MLVAVAGALSELKIGVVRHSRAGGNPETAEPDSRLRGNDGRE